jgi:hypothetical protein
VHAPSQTTTTPLPPPSPRPGLYLEVFGEGRGPGGKFDPYELARRLWGDVWYCPETRTFKRKAAPGAGGRGGWG